MVSQIVWSNSMVRSCITAKIVSSGDQKMWLVNPKIVNIYNPKSKNGNVFDCIKKSINDTIYDTMKNIHYLPSKAPIIGK